MSSIHITESEKRSAYLNFLVAAATANSEVDIDAAIALTNPTTREEMGPKFTDILGYNPITAFDFHDIEEIVDDMFADTSLDLAEKINPKKREKLVRRACELYESLQPGTLLHHRQLCAAGWGAESDEGAGRG